MSLYTPVALDQVFIPLQLKPHQALIDQLLPLEHRRQLSEGITRGEVSPEVVPVLIQAEHNFASFMGRQGSIPFPHLWSGLTREKSAAVIQGTPGMGKSTLLLRLALHMARRSKGVLDDLSGQEFAPLVLPLFISLGPYATFRRNSIQSSSVSLPLSSQFGLEILKQCLHCRVGRCGL